jgi:hypothetical protein
VQGVVVVTIGWVVGGEVVAGVVARVVTGGVVGETWTAVVGGTARVDEVARGAVVVDAEGGALVTSDGGAVTDVGTGEEVGPGVTLVGAPPEPHAPVHTRASSITGAAFDSHRPRTPMWHLPGQTL